MKTSRKNNQRNALPIRFDPRRINSFNQRFDRKMVRSRGPTIGPPTNPRFAFAEDKGKSLPLVPTKNFQEWWVHVWSGLVRDPTAKHYRVMKRAIWLYLYLLVVANRRDGTLFRRVETIEAETGFKSRSIHRWLSVLRLNGYIKTTSSGRSLNISITKWRSISKKRGS